MQTISTYIFIGIMLSAAITSWFLLFTGRFKQTYFPPVVQEKNAARAFFIQSVLMIAAAFLAYVRLNQIQQGHSDNVIENLMYGLSSLLFFRIIGDFRSFGVFGVEVPAAHRVLEKKVYIPLFLFLFVLSLFLVVQ